MPLPRPVLLALVGLVLVGGAFFATRGAGTEEVPPPPPAPPVNPNPKPGGPAKKPEPAKPKKEPNRPEKARKKAPAAPEKAKRPPAKREPVIEGVPRRVGRALATRKIVVLFFHQRGSADDAAVKEAVARLRGRRNVALFSDTIEQLADYRTIVGSLGVTRAPSVVIIGRNRKARVIEGYVDAETLAQEVADSR